MVSETQKARNKAIETFGSQYLKLDVYEHHSRDGEWSVRGDLWLIEESDVSPGIVCIKKYGWRVGHWLMDDIMCVTKERLAVFVTDN